MLYFRNGGVVPVHELCERRRKVAPKENASYNGIILRHCLGTLLTGSDRFQISGSLSTQTAG